MVAAPSLVKQLFLTRSSVASNQSFGKYITENFFGAGEEVYGLPEEDMGRLHVALNSLMRDTFLSKAVSATIAGVEQKTADLITFSRSLVDQHLWERLANVNVVSTNNEPLVAEADFFPLVRNYVADVANTALMGSDFMNKYPHAWQDLWAMDSAMNTFLMRIPRWVPFPGVARAHNARHRLVLAIEDFHAALQKYLRGEDPGSDWHDMSDVSETLKLRAKAFVEIGFTPQQSAPADLAIIWAFNANATQIAFWLIYHLYADPQTLAEVRAEIAPYAKAWRPNDLALPIQEPPRLSLDLEGILKDCPLLRSVYYEVLRFDSFAFSYKEMVSDGTFTESVEDAQIQGRSEPQTYFIPKGQYIAAPSGLHQMDPRYWHQPHTFQPRRFMEQDEKQPEKWTTPDMKTMRPFGGGSTMCKGKTFAERETLCFAAGILRMWDVRPKGGVWRDLGHKQASGAFLPKRDLRVEFRLRV